MSFARLSQESLLALARQEAQGMAYRKLQDIKGWPIKKPGAGPGSK